MKKNLLLIFAFLLCSFQKEEENFVANPATYLEKIKTSLSKPWPGNKTINLVFHGHSVPAGYFKTPVVNTLAAYPFLVLKALKKIYPYAVINIINTSVGGENSISGAKRFKAEVLVHKPDILFIDYALNDRGAGLDASRKAWEKMIRLALRKNIKIILLTPSPDQTVNILAPDNLLEQHAQQIRFLAEKYHIGLADSYAAFREKVATGDSLKHYMSQVNHPNEEGHTLIVEEIMKYFN